MNKNLLFFTLLSFSAATAQQQQQPYQMTPKEADAAKRARRIWDEIRKLFDYEDAAK